MPETLLPRAFDTLLGRLRGQVDPELFTALTRTGVAIRAMATGRYQEALGSLRSARPWLRAYAQQYLELQNLALQAAALQALGDYDAALPLALQAVSIFDRMLEDTRTPEVLRSFAAGDHASVYRLVISLLFLTQRYATAFDYVERARAREFLARMGNPGYKTRPGQDIAAAERLHRLHDEIVSLQRGLQLGHAQDRGAYPTVSLSNAERIQARLQDLQAEYEDLVLQTRMQHPEWTARVRIDTLDMKTLKRDYLPADVTLVSYMTFASRVVVFVIQHEGNHVAEFATGVSGDPARAVKRLQETIDQFSTSIARPTAAFDSLARTLHKQLIAPVAPYIRHQKIILVPHGFLHDIPFAALEDARGRRLLEQYTITYLPSANALRFLSVKGGDFAGRMLAVGDPATDHLEPLRHAAEEARAAARLFDAKPLLGASATENRVRERAKHADLLHLAAHGIYDPDNPRLSHIALAADDGNDGRLEVGELLDEIDLSGVNLTVLSACNTGIGKRSGADDITSLARAFIYAGSRAVVSTMWPVDDEATAKLMAHFYCRLMSGEPPAAALRGAQIALMTSEVYGAPRFWAGFRLTGDHAGPWYPPGRAEPDCALVARGP